MNFFGHAAIATWQSSEPGFVLGSMLPDFATMIRSRPPRATLVPIAAGVAFHHETDHAFHDAPSFRRLTAAALIDLGELGLARGPARAAAHVGVEILIDGVLAREPRARQSYLDALALAARLAPGALVWLDAQAEQRFASLIEALAERGVSAEHSAPEIVALRVERALSARSRLSLAAGDRARVARWAERTRPLVETASSALLRELSGALAASAGERRFPP